MDVLLIRTYCSTLILLVILTFVALGENTTIFTGGLESISDRAGTVPEQISGYLTPPRACSRRGRIIYLRNWLLYNVYILLERVGRR